MPTSCIFIIMAFLHKTIAIELIIIYNISTADFFEPVREKKLHDRIKLMNIHEGSQYPNLKVRILCFAPAILMEYEYHYRYVFLEHNFLCQFLARMNKPGNLQLRALSN